MSIKSSVNKGHGTQPKTDRNMKIAQDFKSGVDVTAIAYHNGITVTRVYAVLRQMGIATKRSVNN